MTKYIKDSIRTVPDFPINGIQFRDITSLIENPQAFDQTISSMISVVNDFKPKTIVGIESRGFVFGIPLAWQSKLPFILARKPGKLPNSTYKKEYKLEYGSGTLEIQQNSNISQQGVMVVDDLIATGGTALACAELIHQHWNVPKDRILIIAVIDLPDLGGSTVLRENGYRVETLVSFEGE